jgi:hypothetical protein
MYVACCLLLLLLPREARARREALQVRLLKVEQCGRALLPCDGLLLLLLVPSIWVCPCTWHGAHALLLPLLLPGGMLLHRQAATS